VIEIRSPIAGSVWKIEKQPGDKVHQDECVLIIESMKMEFPITAPQKGVVERILVTETEMVNEGDIVFVLVVD
jgi:acetyl-CoA carboxylase biotin carboxyl carrier protein